MLRTTFKQLSVINNQLTGRLWLFAGALFALGGMLLPSCTELEVCHELTDKTLKVQFYKDTTDLDDDEFTSAIDTISIIALSDPVDTIVNKQTISTVELALPLSVDSAQFVFIKDGESDTISLFFQRFPKSPSAGCALIMTYEMDTAAYSTNEIQRAELVQPELFIEEELVDDDVDIEMENLKVVY